MVRFSVVLTVKHVGISKRENYNMTAHWYCHSLTGMQIFHNYVMSHEALKGRTPSEAADIKVEVENKWLTLIENVSQAKHKSVKRLLT
jgi:hypothetical protein